MNLLVSNAEEAKAISIPKRFQILELLLHENLSIEEIRKKLGVFIPYTTLVHDITLLKKSGFISVQDLIPKRGAHIKKYSINRGHVL